MKRLFLLLTVCGSIFFLSGCWDRVEINDLAIVTGAAIDKKGDNDVELTIQVFLPNAISSGGGQSGGGGSSGGALTIVTSEKGINLADALSKVQGNLPRKVFWGQCKVFIFGERLAKEGIQKQVDFLLRHPQTRERAYLFVGKGKARQYLESTPKLERTSSEVIRELAKARIGMDATMKDMDEMLMGKAQAAALPYLLPKTYKQKPKESILVPRIFGTAIFRKDRMVGTITERETRGVIWLKNEIKGYTVNVNPKNTAGDVSLDPVSARIRLIPEIQTGEWKMKVQVKTEGTVVQNRTNFSISDPQFLRIVEKAYQESIKKRIHLALQPVQHKLKVDIVGFADEFYRKYPKQFKRVENRWDEVFPNVRVILDVEAHIRRQGSIIEPGGLPEDKVKEK
ncbi:Ger(x)C family spore germination protein [Bacillus sp. EB600]|uniref:Ger(x)C family spore germination protein n=1 Tax=Bacillus sp. EB600 TaxID=2806345 RepID=UPI0021094E41|nr:Ger(x)C family spore germination protein [Bacillus sp. EB600]MCQ6278422.1 Ger(x)C family spore germination protein [Bacillus sp. EB600]